MTSRVIYNPKRRSKKLLDNELRYVPTDREEPEEGGQTILLDGVPKIIEKLTRGEVERALRQKDKREQNATRGAAGLVIQHIKIGTLKKAQDTSATQRAIAANEQRTAWRRKAFSIWHGEAEANQTLSKRQEVAAKIHRERNSLCVSSNDRRSIGTIRNAIKGVKQIAHCSASMPLDEALEKFCRGDSQRLRTKPGRR